MSNMKSIIKPALLLMAVAFAVLTGITGCSKAGGPVHRKMAAAAYYYQETSDGYSYTFYLVEKSGNLIPDPDDALAMKAANYVHLCFTSASESLMGTYTLTDDVYDLPVGKAYVYDNCDHRNLNYITGGTLEVGDGTITITGSSSDGRSYSLSYSGLFQRTGYITTFVK